MKVKYTKWESGKGLEEVQAKIYTEVSGLPATAEEIAPRNDNRGTDATRYALTEDGQPLAYVTSAVNEEEPYRGFIGYPWSLDNCPREAKDKIFDELLDHLKSNTEIKTIRTAIVVASKTQEEQHEYLKNKGFVESERLYRYTKDFDVSEAAKRKVEGKAAELSAKVATEDDIDTLVGLTMTDDQLSRAFGTEEEFRAYFKDRVLADGHCVILYDGNTAVAASAPLKMEPDGRFNNADSTRLMMRFTAIRPGYKYAWERLVTEIAKECKEAGWKEVPLRSQFHYRTDGAVADAMANMMPEMSLYEIFMEYRTS
jgi:hypothetical protein